MSENWNPRTAAQIASPTWLDGQWDVPVGEIAKRIQDSRSLGHGSAPLNVEYLLERLLEYVAEAEQQLTAQRQRIAQLETVSMTDELTGIANRRGFADYLRRTLAAANRRGDFGTVAFLDLDDFKKVNDTHGHAAGDAVLVRVAEVLTTSTRLSDFVARLHGDEFAVLLVGADETQAKNRLHAIQRTLIEEPFDWRGQPISVSLSFGVASYGPETEPAALMQQVDVEMYRQKRARRDREAHDRDSTDQAKSPWRATPSAGPRQRSRKLAADARQTA